MDVGTLLLGSGTGTVLYAAVSAVFNRRKIGADTAAVLSKAAAELVETQAESIIKPLRERIHGLEQEVEALRERVHEATTALDQCHAENARLREQTSPGNA